MDGTAWPGTCVVVCVAVDDVDDNDSPIPRIGNYVCRRSTMTYAQFKALENLGLTESQLVKIVAIFDGHLDKSIVSPKPKAEKPAVEYKAIPEALYSRFKADADKAAEQFKSGNGPGYKTLSDLLGGIGFKALSVMRRSGTASDAVIAKLAEVYTSKPQPILIKK